MRRIFLIICAAMAAFLIVFMVPAFAVGQLFSISGQVIDATGGPVGGANVTLIDNNYNVIGVKTTNTEGHYDFINVNSSTDTVTVRVSLAKKGKTYKVPSYYTRWYPAQGIMTIPKDETQFADYPEPTLGYVYGAILSDTSKDAKFLTGDVYMTSVSTGALYHEFANNTDGKGSFYFHVPPGNYDIYAIHDENGIKTQTATQRIAVQAAWNINEHLPVELVMARSGLSIVVVPFLLAVILGLLALAGLYLTIKRF